MDERRALLAAVLADPDEDTPRLALADWLDEHGDAHDRARAELIRAQVRAARLPEGDPERARLEERAAQLDAEHWATWHAPLRAITGPRSQDNVRFVRGLAKYWFVSTGDFVLKACQAAAADALAAVGVEALALNGPTKKVAVLAASPALRWVARFSWGDSAADDAALGALAASPSFAHLSEFVVDEGKVTDDGLKAFAKAAGLTRMREFGLTGGSQRARYTTAGVLAVLNSDRFPLLDTLNLDGSQPARFWDGPLLGDPGLKRLRVLRLGWYAPFPAVTACRHLTGLSELSFNSINVAEREVDALLANPALAGLRKLSLIGVNWGRPRLSAASEEKLRERFGTGLTLRYSPEHR